MVPNTETRTCKDMDIRTAWMWSCWNIGQVQQQGQTGRGRQSPYSTLAGPSGMHSVDGGGGHGVGITPRGTRYKHGDPYRGQCQQGRKGGKEELSTDSSGGDEKEGMF